MAQTQPMALAVTSGPFNCQVPSPFTCYQRCQSHLLILVSKSSTTMGVLILTA